MTVLVPNLTVLQWFGRGSVSLLQLITHSELQGCRIGKPGFQESASLVDVGSGPLFILLLG